MTITAGLKHLLCGAMLLAVTNSAIAQRPRIAVMSFDVGADAKAGASKQFGMNDDLGRDLSDLLLQKLVSDGKYDVIERTALDKIIAEQNQSNGSRNDPDTAAKIGKLAGVNAIVIATVTQYGGETKDSNTNVSSIPGMSKLGSIGMLHQHSTQVTVKINARMIDTNTGRILSVANGNGEASASKTDVKATNAVYNTKSKDFAGTMVGKATNQAIDALASQLEHGAPEGIAVASAAPPAPAAHVSYVGVVADVSGKTLTLNVGTKAGVKVGDTVQIGRGAREIKDPDTGAVLKVVSDPIGKATVTEADEKSSTATYLGDKPVLVKDRVTSAP